MFGERYIRDPDRVWAAATGSGWGIRTVDLRFAGSAYRFCGLNDSQEQVVRRSYGDLVCDSSGHTTAATVRVVRVDGDVFFPLPPLSEEFSLDFDYGRTAVVFAGYGIAGRFDRNRSSDGALWSPVDSGERFRLVFENCLRVVAAYRLLNEGGVLLHSAGVVRDNRALIFFGKSGAGKSTIARLGLAEKYAILSDDMNAVRPEGPGFCAWPLPFAGDYRSHQVARECIPLAGLFRIEHATKHTVERLAAAISVASLVVCSPFVNRDPHCQDALISSLEALVATTPCAALKFVPDEGLWHALAGGETP